MNTIIQNILVYCALGLSLIYIIRRFIWKPKKKTSKVCGNDGCGCH